MPLLYFDVIRRPTHGVPSWIRIRGKLPRPSDQRLNINMQDARDGEQHRQPVHRADTALDLRKPRLRPADQTGQNRLTRPSAGAVHRDALTRSRRQHPASVAFAPDTAHSSVASLIRCGRGVAGQGAQGRDAVGSRLYTAWAANWYPSLLGYQQPADAQIIGSW